MAILLAFAFLSGIITILSPCILPLLPVILAGSTGQGKARSLGVVTGFVAGFSVFTLSLTTLVRTLNIPADSLRWLAISLIILFGFVLVIPPLHKGFMLLASRAANAFQKLQNKGKSTTGKTAKKTGYGGGMLLGLSLGLVWTPCAGPIMASVVSLALTESLDTGAVLITLVYALGTALPMLAVMWGGRALLKRVPLLVRNTARIQKVFGVIMIITGLAIGMGWDRQIQSRLLQVFPDYGSGLTALENTAPVQLALENRQNTSDTNPEKQTGLLPGTGTQPDPAPEIITDGPWFNTDIPLTMQSLQGKVVLVDFWTYSCINCVRTIPHLQNWYKSYAKQGFVILGIHTPEFEFEKIVSNVEKAIQQLGVTWPVVLDNEFKQWRAYNNRYWPAHYFIDVNGNIRFTSFGEGHYEEAEEMIRNLLREAGAAPQTAGEMMTSNPEASTPEIYLGYKRAHGFASAVAPVADTFINYRPSRLPADGEWNLEGEWLIAGEYVVPASGGTLQLGFTARNVFLVVEPESDGGEIRVYLDQHPAGDSNDVKAGRLTPQTSRLYQLVALEKAGAHHLQLEVSGRLRLFAFTFG